VDDVDYNGLLKEFHYDALKQEMSRAPERVNTHIENIINGIFSYIGVAMKLVYVFFF